MFLETASGARSFPVPAGNDLRAQVAGGRMRATDRATNSNYFSFAYESRNVTVRLNTGLSGVESITS